MRQMARSSSWMLTFAVALAAAQLAIASPPSRPPPPPPSTLWSIISANKDLSTLRDLLDFASSGPGATVNFKAALSNATGPPLTLFAPNNAAFDDLVARLGPLASAKFIGNRTAVAQVLLTHVVAGKALSSAQLSAGIKLTSLQGAALDASKGSSGGAAVVLVAAPGSTGGVLVADLKAGAQVMHVVDAVLLPAAGMVPSRPPPMVRTLYQMVSSDPGLSTLHGLIDLASASGPVNFRQVLSNTSASITLFAPSNMAFDALMETLGTNASQALLGNTTAITEVLLTHLVDQVILSRDLVNKATFASLEGVNLTARRNRYFTQIDSPGNAGFVDTFDLRGGAPVMHVIDGVLVPVASFLPPSLYDILTDRPEFQTLKAMVDFASSYGDVDFATALANRSAAITVFAPINSAFDQLFDDLGPTGTALFSNVTVITGLLLGHVLGRAVNTSSLTNGSIWATTLGTNLTVLVAPDNVTRVVSGGAVAKIIVPNIYGGQAVAHAVDAVLLPDPLPPPGNNSLYDVISASTELSMLKVLLDFASDNSGGVSGGVNFTALLSDRAANLTVFCPVDSAFDSLEVKLGGAAWSALKSNATAVTSLLLTHVLGYVVNGSKLDNGLAMVTQQPGVNLTVKGTTSYTDIVAPGSTGRVLAFNLRGGVPVAHIINGVLLPASVPKPPTPPGQTLYQLLSTDPTFATLKVMVDVASAGAVNFTAVLSNSSQPLTLFAPSSDAFDDFFAEQGISIAALTQNVSAATSILQLHVVLGKAYYQADLVNGLTLPSLLPSANLTITVRPPSVVVAAPGNSGTITQLDLVGGRAVAQALDTVLLATPLLSQAGGEQQQQ